MDHGWRQQWIAMHFGNDLQINDAGYLSRNNTNYLHWQVKRRFTDLPESRYASKDWRWRVSTDHNDHGELLNHQFRMSRESRLRNGSYEYAQINVNSAGVDDLLTRGNGVVELPPNFNGTSSTSARARATGRYEMEVGSVQRRPRRQRQVRLQPDVEPTYFISDAFSVYLGCFDERTPNWLVWQRDNLIGSFDERSRSSTPASTGP